MKGDFFMNIQDLFQRNFAKLQNYQIIFHNQLNNLTAFCEKLEELQFKSYSKNEDIAYNEVNDIKMQVKNVIALLVMALDTLNTNVKALSSVMEYLSYLPDEMLLYYIASEEKVLTSCELSCTKINESLIAVVSVIAKLKNNDDPELSR